MSNKDKTREKLMESMRMTKSDAGKAEDTGATESSKPKAEKPVAKKAAKKAEKKPAAKSAVNADAYQSAQRVWPD